MSSLDDPRVLLAAERTLLAWSRTTAGLIAFGFLIDRSGLVVPGAAPARGGAFWIGIGFIALGVLLSVLSVAQYRRTVAQLRTIEIPGGYWVNLAVFTSLMIALLGLALAVFLFL